MQIHNIYYYYWQTIELWSHYISLKLFWHYGNSYLSKYSCQNIFTNVVVVWWQHDENDKEDSEDKIEKSGKVKDGKKILREWSGEDKTETVLKYSWIRNISCMPYTQRNLFEILLNQTEINRKMVNTNRFRFDLLPFGEYFAGNCCQIRLLISGTRRLIFRLPALSSAVNN